MKTKDTLCSTCDNKTYDLNQGAICSFTNERSLANNQCNLFTKKVELNGREIAGMLNYYLIDEKKTAKKRTLSPLIPIAFLLLIGVLMIAFSGGDDLFLSKQLSFVDYVWNLPIGLMYFLAGAVLFYRYFKQQSKTIKE